MGLSHSPFSVFTSLIQSSLILMFFNPLSGWYILSYLFIKHELDVTALVGDAFLTGLQGLRLQPLFSPLVSHHSACP